jgi:SAM-dependent methyltransferase
MKPAYEVVATCEEEEFLRRFDLREIDSRPPSFWTRKYVARLNTVLSIIERSVPRGGTILDLGCAQGNLAILAGERGYRTVAIDLRPGFLTYARKKDDRSVVRWVVGDALTPPIRLASCDAVVLGELLEHVADPGRLLAAAVRLVKPGGILIATTPNGSCFRNASLPSFSRASRDRAALEARQCGPSGEDHLFALRPRELVSLIPAEMELVDVAFVSSGLWNRWLGVVAGRLWLAHLIESLSRWRPWRHWLCETIVLVLRSPMLA